jgi:Putative  PD-(D/E)XK family member, (DUF4420)
LLAGRYYPSNQESLLIGFRDSRLPNRSTLPQCRGFAVDTVELEFRGGRYHCLAISRRPSASVELFTVMLEDLVAILERDGRSEEGRIRAVGDRIVGWQKFMSRDDEGLLKGEQELGLLGELQVLRLLLSAGLEKSAALEWWQGPLDSLHDFVATQGELEVKTSTRVGNFAASISSLDQLDESLVTPLYLAAVQFELSPNGLRLPEVVEFIRDELKKDAFATQVFEYRLLAAGYHNHAAPRYHRQFSYLITDFYEIGSQFPRLTKGTVPKGVIEAVYRIEVDPSRFKSISLAEMLPRLGYTHDPR